MKYAVIVEKDEVGYYVGSVPELPGCHTQAKTIDELLKRVKEAIELYLECEGNQPKEHIEIGGPLKTVSFFKQMPISTELDTWLEGASIN